MGQVDRTREYRRRNPEKVKAWKRAHYLRYAESIKEKQRLYRRANLDRAREIKFKSTYGITLADYDAMLVAQNGGCALCDSPISGRADRPRLYVDHDHATGRVRGLLCHGCNAALARFDVGDRIERVVRYLGSLSPTFAVK